MSCETDTSCTTETSCGPTKSQTEGQCTMAEDLLCLAKSAIHDLLKEKMKKVLEAKIGKKLDKMAEVAATAALACKEHEMAGKQACQDYKDNLMAAFKG